MKLILSLLILALITIKVQAESAFTKFALEGTYNGITCDSTNGVFEVDVCETFCDSKSLYLRFQYDSTKKSYYATTYSYQSCIDSKVVNTIPDISCSSSTTPLGTLTCTEPVVLATFDKFSYSMDDGNGCKDDITLGLNTCTESCGYQLLVRPKEGFVNGYNFASFETLDQCNTAPLNRLDNFRCIDNVPVDTFSNGPVTCHVAPEPTSTSTTSTTTTSTTTTSTTTTSTSTTSSSSKDDGSTNSSSIISFSMVFLVSMILFNILF